MNKTLSDLLDLEKRIRRTAQSLDRLKNGALTACFGGGVVVGAVGGHLWWVPAAMSGALLVYRGIQFCFERQDARSQRRLEEWDSIYARMKELAGTTLPSREAEALGAALIRQLPNPERRLMLPPADLKTPVSVASETERESAG